jgi:UDP-4-amino-4-deoxy-L-arabinose-oxoglutarate aminotransferase
MSRWEFVDALKAANIGTGIHFLALHLQTYYRDRFGHQPGAFPNAEYIAARTVSLPLSVSMSDEDVRDVISAVKSVLRRKTSTGML